MARDVLGKCFECPEFGVFDGDSTDGPWLGCRSGFLHLRVGDLIVR